MTAHELSCGQEMMDNDYYRAPEINFRCHLIFCFCLSQKIILLVELLPDIPFSSFPLFLLAFFFSIFFLFNCMSMRLSLKCVYNELPKACSSLSCFLVLQKSGPDSITKIAAVYILRRVRPCLITKITVGGASLE